MVQGIHDGGPVRAAIKQFGTLATGAWVRWLCAEILHVDSHNPFAEHLNPSLRRALAAAHIANVKMPAHPLAVDRIQISQRLFRFGDEIVANVLDRDFYP